MKKDKKELRDPVVQSVVNKFVDRSDVGFKKYGKTLRDDDSDVFQWLNHVQEELMDATLYIQRLKEEISSLREEKMLLKELNDIDVIDSFTYVNKETFPETRGNIYEITIDDDCVDSTCCKKRNNPWTVNLSWDQTE
jgi:hypothetical protein